MIHERLPALADLGVDLLITTPWQRRVALTRPLVLLACFAAAWQAGWWWLGLPLVFLIFVAIVTATHDVVHGSLGLSPRQTEWWLFALGAVLLESGHAYRTTHHQHHRVFPGSDDPEGDPARMPFWLALVWGPVFLPRLWWWAYRRNAGRADQQRWLLVEAIWAIAAVALSIAILPATKGPAWYVALALGGSWVYPLLTVHLPHRHYGETPLTQTGTLRGLIVPALFLELTYHLEHHLYPAVPSHHLAELSRRLEPTLLAHGVRPRWVP
jgi:beta-carotene hydroxylase